MLVAIDGEDAGSTNEVWMSLHIQCVSLLLFVMHCKAEQISDSLEVYV